ncbi:MAG: hypothetical protein Q7J05_04250 [Paludibacter sp.]|nr:hypothetical protein [Paludibacter sp.]
MAHLIITLDGDDSIDMDLKMTPEQFIEAFITLMQESDDFKRLVLASVDAFKMHNEQINHG